jgi:myo-inositol-1(or 4)-monophosphatase
VIDAVLEAAVTGARAAGELLRRARADGVRAERKGDADITTAADLACEALLYARIAAAFPDHGVLAEEGASRRPGALWRWVIDPLDGTKNFAHGSLRCAVSIAVERGGEAVVGVVYAPFVDELYTAVRGEGARCNGARLRVSTVATLDAAMVASAMTYAGRTAEPGQVARLLRVFAAAQALRATGCAALDLADVARGRYDAFFEPGLQAWDTAAGALLVTEAGGAVSRFDGSAHAPWDADVLASNGALHRELVALLCAEARP